MEFTNTFWVEATGTAGSIFAVATYWMKDMLSLRIVALIACVFFIAYALMIASLPILMMELVLLPINAMRLLELRKAQRKFPAALADASPR